MLAMALCIDAEDVGSHSTSTVAVDIGSDGGGCDVDDVVVVAAVVVVVVAVVCGTMLMP
jgi:hypothetical protein